VPRSRSYVAVRCIRPHVGAAAAAVLVLAAALPIVGCGSDKEPQLKGALTVYAASPLSAPFRAIGERFESANSGVKVNFRFGSSGSLFELIDPRDPRATGAADVFATSDTDVIHGLSGNDESNGNDEVTGNPNSATIFVSDALSIVTAPGNPMRIRTLADLAKPSTRVVLGSRRTKVGLVARNMLARNAVEVRPALQAASAPGVIEAVAAGRADAGIVYGSDADPAGKRVTTVAIATSKTLVTDYEAALVLRAARSDLGMRFMTFLFTEGSQKALTHAGFRAIACKGPAANCGPSFTQ
jgi:molybdate transport system substrate-binding protein